MRCREFALEPFLYILLYNLDGLKLKSSYPLLISLCVNAQFNFAMTAPTQLMQHHVLIKHLVPRLGVIVSYNCRSFLFKVCILLLRNQER
jgi:hypothetical protein